MAAKQLDSLAASTVPPRAEVVNVWLGDGPRRLAAQKRSSQRGTVNVRIFAKTDGRSVRPGWALCRRHPNFVNDCFGELKAGLGTTRLGRKQLFAGG